MTNIVIEDYKDGGFFVKLEGPKSSMQDCIICKSLTSLLNTIEEKIGWEKSIEMSKHTPSRDWREVYEDLNPEFKS